jgi:alkylation response protein AidB-like acyl-CoA dehydrogenase
MDFEWSEEQRALQDSLERLLSQRWGHEQRRAVAGSDPGYSEDLWSRLAEMGVTALPVPEAYDGIGGNAVDLLPVLQAFGRTQLAVPFLGTTVLAAAALQQGKDEDTKRRWLPAIAAGQAQLAWAHDERGARPPTQRVAVRAAKGQAGWTLEGEKINVLYGASARHHLVTAHVGGTADAHEGPGLFLVAADAPGVSLRPHRLIDDTPSADLWLGGAPATPVSLQPQEAGAAIDAALAAGIAAACAEMVGSMEAAFALTVEYLNTRKQFGRVIGQNQALRHRVAEMLVGLEMARSMAIAAAVAAADPARADAALDLHRAKLLVGRNARALCQAAIQLHGGIGMTQEYAVGHCLRRVHVLDMLFGNGDVHAARLAELSSKSTPSFIFGT